MELGQLVGGVVVPSRDLTLHPPLLFVVSLIESSAPLVGWLVGWFVDPVLWLILTNFPCEVFADVSGVPEEGVSERESLEEPCYIVEKLVR